MSHHKRTDIKSISCRYCKADNSGNYRFIKIIDLGGRKCRLECICGAKTEVKGSVQEALNAWERGEIFNNK